MGGMCGGTWERREEGHDAKKYVCVCVYVGEGEVGRVCECLW